MTEVIIPIQVETKTIEENVVLTESLNAENVLESNGDATTNEMVANKANEKKEELETLKDLTVDPVGWLKQQIPAAVHKVNKY